MVMLCSTTTAPQLHPDKFAKISTVVTFQSLLYYIRATNTGFFLVHEWYFFCPRYLLKALDMYWHEDCLKCGCCDCRLGEVGSTLYTKGNLILCKRDYLRQVQNLEASNKW